MNYINIEQVSWTERVSSLYIISYVQIQYNDTNIIVCTLTNYTDNDI